MSSKTLKVASESILLPVVAFLSPIQGVLGTVLLLVVLDLVTGVLASRRHKRKITSTGFKKTVLKLLVYESTIILSYLVSKYLTPDLPVLNLASSLIGLTELKSVVENLNILSGGSAVTNVVRALQRMSSNSSKDDDDRLPPDSQR